MSCPVMYWILRRPSGGFAVVVVISPDKIHLRGGLATLAEAEEWAKGLRVLM